MVQLIIQKFTISQSVKLEENAQTLNENFALLTSFFTLTALLFFFNIKLF